MKKLGFGLMRMPTFDKTNPADVDVEQVKKMIDLFMEKGFTYFDTAWMYNGFASESVAKTALVDRYQRDRFTLATKLHNGFFNSLEDMDKIFNSQLEKTGAGYFDYYLLHGIDGSSIAKYEKFDCFNWLLDKKAQGLVKHVGFSYHDSAEILNDILIKHPEIEFVQLQPLTDEENKICFKVADIINEKIAVPCTGCSYCTEGCPMKIAIPQYFSLYNENMRENLEEKGFTINFSNYALLAEKFGKAKDCIECGQCESVCPQHLPIMENLKAVSSHFDN